MIDERVDSTHDIDEPGLDLSPPYFDEEATAKARPVQPLAGSRISAWQRGVVYLRRAITNSSRALVLVVIAGLLTGMVCGMALVKVDQVRDASPVANQSVSEVSPSSPASFEEPRAEASGSTEPRSVRSENRIGEGRSRLRSRRAPRAYLVEVLR